MLRSTHELMAAAVWVVYAKELQYAMKTNPSRKDLSRDVSFEYTPWKPTDLTSFEETMHQRKAQKYVGKTYFYRGVFVVCCLWFLTTRRHHVRSLELQKRHTCTHTRNNYEVLRKHFFFFCACLPMLTNNYAIWSATCRGLAS